MSQDFKGNYSWFPLTDQEEDPMVVYLTLIVTSILVGLVAVLMARPNHRFSMRAFLAGGVANAIALGAAVLYQKRREQ